MDEVFQNTQVSGIDSVMHSNCTWSDFKCSSLQRKEGNVLFNETLNTFYLRLYGIRNASFDWCQFW